MSTEQTESTVDPLAKTADAAEDAVKSVAQTVGERMSAAVAKAGHSGHQRHKLTDKVVRSAEKVNEAIAHAVKEAATRQARSTSGR
jgi:hypothetical protein